MTTRGPFPFITYRSYLLHGERRLWLARQSRKGLLHRDPARAPVWQRPAYNWWTGASFAVGSLLFLLGAIFSVVPNPLTTFQIAVVFFAGSIPFTMAGFLQNFQAANAAGLSAAKPDQTGPLRIIGWRPGSLGWLSTVTQFAGTIAFNFNTFDAINPDGGWSAQNLTIWLPDMVGSILFLVSGYFAFMETSHGYWSWKPRDLDWKIVFINLMGCVFFMTAAILGYIPKGPEPGWIAVVANVHLGLGAFCFLVGSLLMMRESAETKRHALEEK